jgi:hypothetical protein
MDAPWVTQPPRQLRSFGQVLSEAFRIYRAGFFQFLALTAMVHLPLICAQLSATAVKSTSTIPDLSAALASVFALTMSLLALSMWPVYIAGIQLVSAELVAGRKTSVFDRIGEILRFWPRVAILCIFVYGVYVLLTVFALFIAAMMVAGASWPFLILVALGLLALQVWMFCRFFVNVLFWQQFAVLGDCDGITTLRESKQFARGGSGLAWHQRPMWRGGLIVSLWIVFVMLLYLGPEWTLMQQYWDYFLHLMSGAEPEPIFREMRDRAAQTQPFSSLAFGLGILQTLLRPLLGIAFVILYIDGAKNEEVPPRA